MTETITMTDFRKKCKLLNQGFGVLRQTNTSFILQNRSIKTGTSYKRQEGKLNPVTAKEQAATAISQICKDDCPYFNGGWQTGEMIRGIKGRCIPEPVDNSTATIEARIGV